MQVRESAHAYKTEKKYYTYQDYLELPDDGDRYQIIDGELVMSPSPLTIHQRIIRRIMFTLESLIRQNKKGEVLVAPVDVILSKHNIYQPDIIFVADENKNIITEKNIEGAPDLIFEILSPSTGYYDLVEKKDNYEKYGVKEYWIVDPKKKWIEVYLLKSKKYQVTQSFVNNGVAKSSIVEGFELDLKHIFKEEK